MNEGIVKFFNETKGFGFITPNDGGNEVFVHVSGLTQNIRENDHVSFDIQDGKKGPNAVNVKLI
ncbi:MAG: cold-shock protein [Sphingobacterium sp.]|jgi:CspA family cold shock protein|uniref:Putative cold-shock DNA-binding protein n=1 Tax=Sphingobacterium yanglingense TaxID=1437280 RepID=A0A4R6WMS2_9SPHI|nr:cold-shock protein [Sphingobacterium yanglingense]MDR2285576.1 cold-shock protein [Sphingobacterium sp.]TDQ80082.1 putative cold-shock DNA-binding protein [Sphingobacterium yanglingense]